MKTLVRFLVIGCIVVGFGALQGEMLPSHETAVEADAPPASLPIQWKPEPPSQWSEGGRDQVNRIIGKVQALMNKINTEGALDKARAALLEDFFGGNGKLTAYDGVTLRGGKAIAQHFDKLIKDHAITNFRISIEYILAEELTHMVTKTPQEDDDVIHTIYFIFTTSYNMDGRPIDPTGETNYRHIRMCDDDNDG